ncbi:M20 family metallopeptidase [Candidatus Microgenomates bacterium]|nr:M20 family metallopeptidase [Candidatus Microgenomates bacterium]MBI2622421.1 M20 family metallopeptidase [Candidatus Microgenomates bacterium]
MKILQKLIQIPSISGNENKIQKFIAKYLEKLGCSSLLVKGNIMAKIPGKDHKKCLIFNAHVDTVEAGDIKRWKDHPYTGKIVGGKIYGLGASDEKAAVMAFLNLIKYYKTKKPPLDLWFMFVVREEIDGSGTQNSLNFLNQLKYLGKYQKISAILGEPTSLKSVYMGHRGNIFVRLTAYGNSGHGSRSIPYAEHAVFKLVKIVNLLKRLEKQWQSKYSHPVLGQPTIGIFTTIQGGMSVNKFPDSCMATLDIRTTPNLHLQVLPMLKKTLQPFDVKVDYYAPPVEPGLTSKSERIVKIAQDATRLPVLVDTISCDLAFFTKLGIPAIILGPGTREVIHQTNEYVEIKNIKTSIKFYQKIIEAF